MKTRPGKILLVEETGFLRVCSSILETEGFAVEAITAADDNWASRVSLYDCTLVILNYPYGKFISEEIRNLALPVIVLSDHISEEILCMLERFEKSYCLVKPLDYTKFKNLVRQLMNGDGLCYAD